jgi:hypothetical protein
MFAYNVMRQELFPNWPPLHKVVANWQLATWLLLLLLVIAAIVAEGLWRRIKDAKGGRQFRGTGSKSTIGQGVLVVTGEGNVFTNTTIQQISRSEESRDGGPAPRKRTPKIRIVPKEERSMSRDDTGHYAYLEINNGETEDLSDCYVALVAAYAETGMGWLNWLRHVNPNGSNLAWPLFKPEAEKIIRRKKGARVNIAKTIANNVAFTLEDGDHPGLGVMASNNFYIEMEFNGKLNAAKLPGRRVKGFLRYVAKLIQEPDRPPGAYYRLYFEEGVLPAKERAD